MDPFLTRISQAFVVGTQTGLWVLFSVIDIYLWVPNSVWRIWKKQQARQGPQGSRKKHKVVIVGGSFAGLTVYRELQHHPDISVRLIDQKDFFEYTPGILRLYREPESSKALVHKHKVDKEDLVLGTVIEESSSDNRVTYMEKSPHSPCGSNSHSEPIKSLSFDYLVLATGSKYQYPVSPTETTYEERIETWYKEANRVQRASSVLILGGGAVGTELAAEIVDEYPHKKVTLVDAADRLVPIFAKSVSSYAQKWLTCRGVQVILGEKLESWSQTGCTFVGGRRLEADLVFVCFGGRPNSSMIGATNSGESRSFASIGLDRRKCILTNEYLQARSPDVYCCGDVASPPSEGVKQAFHAEVMGHVVADNILRSIDHQHKAPLVRYPQDMTFQEDSMPMVYVLSLGKWDGVVGVNELTIPGPLAAIVKWLLEWTKVAQAQGRPIGTLIWKIGDPAAMLLSKYLVRPAGKAKVN